MSELRLMCSGKGKHRPRELELLTSGLSDTGERWLFGRDFNDSSRATTRPRRTSDQRVILESESAPWRFVCPTCRLDMRLSNKTLWAMFDRFATHPRVASVDLSDPSASL